MTVASDIAGDWQSMGDIIEDVTHTDATDATEQTEVKAYRADLSFREISANGPAGLEPADIVWCIWAETLAVVPAQGDTLTDSANVVWSVLALSAVSIGVTVVKWRCICRREA